MRYELTLKFRDDDRRLALGVFDANSESEAKAKAEKKYKSTFAKLVCGKHWIHAVMVPEELMK